MNGTIVKLTHPSRSCLELMAVDRLKSRVDGWDVVKPIYREWWSGRYAVKLLRLPKGQLSKCVLGDIEWEKQQAELTREVELIRRERAERLSMQTQEAR